MDRRTIAGTIFGTLFAVGAPAVISALTLAAESPYRDIILVAGMIASVVGIAGLVGMLFIPAKIGKNERPAGTSYTVSNTGSGFALGHGTVNVGQQRFELTDEVLAEIAGDLDQARPVSLFWRDTGRTPKVVARLKEYLKASGFQLGAETSFVEMTGVSFEKPILVSSNGFQFGGLTILGGCQAIGIDASAA
ncbi:hypothetical protein [Tsuneonella sp. HG222]